MCNACGFRCCGSDEFARCGCDWCDEPNCRAEEELDDDDDGYECRHIAPRVFICDSPTLHPGAQS